jgi:hypothetical protein
LMYFNYQKLSDVSGVSSRGVLASKSNSTLN